MRKIFIISVIVGTYTFAPTPSWAQVIWNDLSVGEKQEKVFEKLKEYNPSIKTDKKENSSSIIVKGIGTRICGYDTTFYFDKNKGLNNILTISNMDFPSLPPALRKTCDQKIIQGLRNKYGEPSVVGTLKGYNFVEVVYWAINDNVYIEYRNVDSFFTISYSTKKPENIIPYRGINSGL